MSGVDIDTDKEKKMYFLKTSARVYVDYKPAKLSVGKEWIISFYVRCPQTNKLRRIKQKVNHLPAARRRFLANQMVADINTRLALGWNPLVEALAPQSYMLLSDALDSFLKVKSKESESGTMRVYRSYVKIFKAWLESHGIGHEAYACSITKEIAMAFMNSVDADVNISPRTYNNYLKFYQTMFNWMKGKGFTSGNPFLDIPIKPKRLTKKIRRLMTDDELERMISYLKENNKEYLFAAMLCYCCLIRPKELALLKCSDIDLEHQLVHIRSEIAKNDNDSYRTIPDDLMPLVRQIDLSHPDWYLFADHKMYDFSPGKNQVNSRKIAKYWSDHLRKECHFPMNLQFYSLKDTGITNMIERGIPINLVQQQADHSSVAMTAIYVGHKKTANQEIKHVSFLKL